MRRERERVLERFDKGIEIEIPENPGPRIFGRTPVIGIVRRALDLPVLRDELNIPTIIEIPPILKKLRE